MVWLANSDEQIEMSAPDTSSLCRLCQMLRVLSLTAMNLGAVTMHMTLERPGKGRTEKGDRNEG